MSLTSSDLNEIRNIIESALAKPSYEAITPMQGELEALHAELLAAAKQVGISLPR